MGAEQSATIAREDENPSTSRRVDNLNRIQKRNTIYSSSTTNDEEFRPTSPPISVCSDSDIPYISYTTDRPIGDSPKIYGKSNRNFRQSSISTSLRSKTINNNKQRPSSSGHNIVVVKSGTKESMDSDLLKIQNIPTFFPVMRGSLTYPGGKDPDILNRLHPIHLQNICSRMQTHFNVCATQVANNQGKIMGQIKEIDAKVTKLFSNYIEIQKKYATYAETFSKIRSISQQLSRCNTLLNQNIESMEELNKILNVENRVEMEPFIWKTTNY